ncbi:hypothetical protein ACFVVM_32580 [Nocardia sp. NPDC058176]|uniref:hypothetical protein n=1 Tax=Nocardia sp. NPDC058176 TaxID=3346368 RepID=UPI0036DF6124
MSHEYRIEVRTNFFGTEEQVYVQAEQLARACGGEVTAIFDAENGYEELPTD